MSSSCSPSTVWTSLRSCRDVFAVLDIVVDMPVASNDRCLGFVSAENCGLVDIPVRKEMAGFFRGLAVVGGVTAGGGAAAAEFLKVGGAGGFRRLWTSL